MPTKEEIAAAAAKAAAVAAKAKSKQEKMIAAQAKKSVSFKVRAVKFVTRSLATLELVAALADRKRNVYDPEQSKKIVTALRAAVDRIEKRFESSGASENDSGFKL